MSDTQMVYHINHTPELNNLWNDMSKAEHYVVIEEAEGETLLLKELMEDIIDRRPSSESLK